MHFKKPGDRYGRLVLVAKAEKVGTNSRWLCRCDCGNETTVYACALSQNNTQSCGCLKRELRRAAMPELAAANKEYWAERKAAAARLEEYWKKP